MWLDREITGMGDKYGHYDGVPVLANDKLIS